MITHPRTALVHEWIVARTGSELCFERMAGLLPEADLYALSQADDVGIDTGSRSITTSRLNKVAATPLGRALSLPVMSSAFRSMRSADYDLVVTSTHSCSRAFALRTDVHLSYTYSPMRYAWYPEIDSRASAAMLAPARSLLRRADRKSASTVDSFAAISTEIASRIEECYGRKSEIIFPPCDTSFFHSGAPGGTEGLPSEYTLSVGRWIPYKRHDLAIAAAEQANIPLVIAGFGPDGPKLRRLAAQSKGDVTFIESPSREVIRGLYRGAAATIFAPEEDFGIVPVESLACGTPVLGLAAGGSLDTIGQTGGVLVEEQTSDAFAEGLQRLLSSAPPSDVCRARAELFSIDRFDREFTSWVSRSLAM